MYFALILVLELSFQKYNGVNFTYYLIAIILLFERLEAMDHFRSCLNILYCCPNTATFATFKMMKKEIYPEDNWNLH